MDSHKNINSLRELELRQKKLNQLIGFTQERFEESLNRNQQGFKQLLMKRIALPAGVVSAGWMLTQQFKQPEATPTTQLNSSLDSSPTWWAKLLPLGLQLLQSYLIKNQMVNEESV